MERSRYEKNEKKRQITNNRLLLHFSFYHFLFCFMRHRKINRDSIGSSDGTYFRYQKILLLYCLLLYYFLLPAFAICK